jgi:hypothetical protein
MVPLLHCLPIQPFPVEPRKKQGYNRHGVVVPLQVQSIQRALAELRPSALPLQPFVSANQLSGPIPVLHDKLSDAIRSLSGTQLRQIPEEASREEEQALW